MANLIRENWESEKYFKNEIILPERSEVKNFFFSSSLGNEWKLRGMWYINKIQ